MSNEDRTTTFSVKKNRFESVKVSYEVCHKTPVVSIRSHRGDSFTGKGLSMRLELWDQVLPELVNAIKSFRQELASNGTDVPVKQVIKAGPKNDAAYASPLASLLDQI